MGARCPTIRDLSSMATMTTTMSTRQQTTPSPATWFLEDDDGKDAEYSVHHFLDECRMCGRRLPRDREIYMYKGDTPFCSEDCRDEQIGMDEYQLRAEKRRRAKAAASRMPLVSVEVESRADALAVAAV